MQIIIFLVFSFIIIDVIHIMFYLVNVCCLFYYYLRLLALSGGVCENGRWQQTICCYVCNWNEVLFRSFSKWLNAYLTKYIYYKTVHVYKGNISAIRIFLDTPPCTLKGARKQMVLLNKIIMVFTVNSKFSIIYSHI